MNFWKLWAASTIFNLGDGVTLVAGPLLAASLTRDPVLVAGVAFVQRLPWLLLSLISGALVDRLTVAGLWWPWMVFALCCLVFSTLRC